MALEKRTVARSPLLQQIMAQGAIAPPQNFQGMHPLAAAMHGIAQGLERRALRKAEAEKQKLADQAGAELRRALTQTELAAQPTVQFGPPEEANQFSYGTGPHVVGGKPSDIAAALMNPDLTAQQAQVGSNIMQNRQAAQQAAADDKRRFARETMLQDARIAADERLQRERAASDERVAKIRSTSGQNKASGIQHWEAYQYIKKTQGEEAAEEFMRVLGRPEPLSKDEAKWLAEAQDKVLSGETNINNIMSISSEFEAQAKAGMSSGVYATATEAMRDIIGSQNDVSALRTRYRQLRNTNVIQNLPPGVASDRDIAIAMEGWPPDNASPEHIAAFMRVMVAAEIYQVAQNRHKAEYIGTMETRVNMLPNWETNKDMYLAEEFAKYGMKWNPGERKAAPNPGAPAQDAPAAPTQPDKPVNEMTRDEILQEAGLLPRGGT